MNKYLLLVQNIKSYKKWKISLDNINFFADNVAITNRYGCVHISKGCLGIGASYEKDMAELGLEFGAREATVFFSLNESNDSFLSTSARACTLPLGIPTDRLFWRRGRVLINVKTDMNHFMFRFILKSRNPRASLDRRVILNLNPFLVQIVGEKIRLLVRC